MICLIAIGETSPSTLSKTEVSIGRQEEVSRRIPSNFELISRITKIKNWFPMKGFGRTTIQLLGARNERSETKTHQESVTTSSSWENVSQALHTHHQISHGVQLIGS